MTAKMTQADFDAMFEAASAAGIVGGAVHEPDPPWLARSKRLQDAARASVEAEDELREPTIGEKAASFAAGAAESASMGAAPYAKGAAKAFGPLLLGGAAGFAVDDPISGIPERFREGVESQRESAEPMRIGKIGASYGAGHLTGDVAGLATGLAAPLRSAATAVKGLAGGARVGDVLSTGLAPAALKLRKMLATPLKAAGERADELRVLTTSGATGGSINAPAVLREAERVPGGVPAMAEHLRKTGISQGITTTGGIAKRADALMESSGKKIGQMVDESAAAGGFVDTKALTTRLRAEAVTAEVEAGNVPELFATTQRHAEELRRMADTIEKAAPGGVMPIDQVKRLSTGFGAEAEGAYAARAADRSVGGLGKALMDTRRQTEGAIGETIEGLGLDRGAYQGAKKDFQVSRIASEAAETSLGRAGKNSPFGLTTAVLSQTTPGLAMVHQVLKPLYASGRATWAESARALGNLLDPGTIAALGPAGVKLKQASLQGGPALKQAYDELMRTDDVFAGMVGADSVETRTSETGPTAADESIPAPLPEPPPSPFTRIQPSQVGPQSDTVSKASAGPKPLKVRKRKP